MKDQNIELPPLPIHPKTLKPYTHYSESQVIALQRAAVALDRQRRGEPVAWLVSGPYQKQAFAMESSAEAFCRGLNKGFEETAYSVSALYAAPQPADPAVKQSLTVDEPVKVPSAEDLLQSIIIYADARAMITENRLPGADRETDRIAHDDCAQAYADMTALLSRYGQPAQPAASVEPVDKTLSAHTDLLTYVLQDDIHNRLTHRVIDIAYTAFMQAKRPNIEDGGESDWFNDTKPVVMEAIVKLRKDLFAERAPVAAQPSVPDGKHPIQPLIIDEYGRRRFKANTIVQYLLDNGPFDMNALACLSFSQEDREQFAQLIGYSLGGFGDLSYVSDETYARAEAAPAPPADGQVDRSPDLQRTQVDESVNLQSQAQHDDECCHDYVRPSDGVCIECGEVVVQPDPAMVVDFPVGAIENGRAFAERLEAGYGFQCEAGRLQECADWQEFRRCFEHLADWALTMRVQPATGEDAIPARATTSSAPSFLGTNDKAFWTLGWNDCLEAMQQERQP